MAQLRKTECYFSSQSLRAIEHISFGKYDSAYQEFVQSEPDFAKTFVEKIGRQARTDAMLWAYFDRKPVVNGVIDCSEYLERCYKARVATQINAHTELLERQVVSYCDKILSTVKRSPGLQREALKNVVEKSCRLHKAVNEDIDYLLATGSIEIRVPANCKGRPPQMFYIAKEGK